MLKGENKPKCNLKHMPPSAFKKKKTKDDLGAFEGRCCDCIPPSGGWPAPSSYQINGAFITAMPA